MSKINHLRKNRYSQNGEDGVISYLLNNMKNLNGWCCEFGAFDGKYLSNTFNLVENFGFNAVYIEPNASRFKVLLETCEQYSNIVPVNQMVGIRGDYKLDTILSKTDIPKNFDLLSIDVDGIDYLIWEAFEKYEPKIVIIEINSSKKPDLLMTNEELDYDRLLDLTFKESPDSGVNFRTCYELGRKKKYKLFGHTGNMIFIHEDHVNDIQVASDENYLDYFDSSWLR